MVLIGRLCKLCLFLFGRLLGLSVLRDNFMEVWEAYSRLMP
jgi:hypothetical protein